MGQLTVRKQNNFKTEELKNRSMGRGTKQLDRKLEHQGKTETLCNRVLSEPVTLTGAAAMTADLAVY